MATWKWVYRELQGDEEISTNYHASSPRLCATSLAQRLSKTYIGATLQEIRSDGDIFVIVLSVPEFRNPLYIHARASGFDAPWLPGDHNEKFNQEFMTNFEKSFA